MLHITIIDTKLTYYLFPKKLKVKQRYRAGLVCIDCLSKYAVVVPVRRKETGSVVQGTKKAIEKMGKKPEIIYTDDEKAIASGEFQAYVESEKDWFFLTWLGFFDLFRRKPCRRQTDFARNGSVLAWFGKGSWVSTVSIAEGFRSTWLGSMRNLRCGGVGGVWAPE